MRTSPRVAQRTTHGPERNPRGQNASLLEDEIITVLVGPKRQAFFVGRMLLCDASLFFRDMLRQDRHSASLTSSTSLGDVFYTARSATLWLASESTTMFGLFVKWLHAPCLFRSYLHERVSLDVGVEGVRLLHWALIRLHIFAAHLGLLVLQDLAMDAIQDLYLHLDWDISPSVVAYLYTHCESRHTMHLRRWAIAMVAFALSIAWHLSNRERDAAGRRLYQRTASSSSSSASAVCDPARLQNMLDALPDLKADYVMHVRSMRNAGLDMRFKNPQLRIPASALHTEKCAFGFQECSFHSHRAAVRSEPCPHATSESKPAEMGVMRDLAPRGVGPGPGDEVQGGGRGSSKMGTENSR